MTLEPLGVTLRLDARDLPLAPVRGYVAQALPLSLDAGAAGAQGDIDLSLATPEAPGLVVRKGAVQVSGLSLSLTGQKQPSVGLGRLEVTDTSVDLAARTVAGDADEARCPGGARQGRRYRPRRAGGGSGPGGTRQGPARRPVSAGQGAGTPGGARGLAPRPAATRRHAGSPGVEGDRGLAAHGRGPRDLRGPAAQGCGRAYPGGDAPGHRPVVATARRAAGRGFRRALAEAGHHRHQGQGHGAAAAHDRGLQAGQGGLAPAGPVPGRGDRPAVRQRRGVVGTQGGPARAGPPGGQGAPRVRIRRTGG